MNSSDTAIMSFDQVVVQGLDDAPPAGLTFSLPRDRCAWLEMEPDDVELMADVAIGLVAPDSGQVCFEGQCWESRPPEAHADARARIRRVFSHKGWISNLDIDENMILARYHHGDANEEELREACKAVADEIGLSVLSGRPEAFHTRQLQPLQWIRALVGESDLLVVGHRRELINSDCGTLLAKALNRRIESGLSVLWLGSDLPDVLRGVPDPWLYAKLGPSGISFREMT